MKVELVWSTPNGEALIAKMARVSNPSNENNTETAPRLISYLIRNGHWSPFEMANVCVQIECPRDISRQILRHRSFSFQEFSGRYATYDDLEAHREGRLQDHANRQNSIPIVDDTKAEKWASIVQGIRDQSLAAYRSALDLGIAKECARAVLPEGLVPTRMYMNGTLRSWLHYFAVRCDPATQKEHREVAEAIRAIVFKEFPMIAEAVENK